MEYIGFLIMLFGAVLINIGWFAMRALWLARPENQGKRRTVFTLREMKATFATSSYWTRIVIAGYALAILGFIFIIVSHKMSSGL
jgi:hypothetical protein